MIKMTRKREIIEAASKVISEYTTRLTIRQIYYRLVAAHKIENRVSQYQAVVKALRDARLEGLIQYRRIEDRTRSFIGGDVSYETPEDHFQNVKDYFLECDEYYYLPKWYNQPNYVEVWLEKQALAALFNQVTSKWKVRLGPCKGYPSLTFLWEGAIHLRRIQDRKIHVLYFGDFDPSGLDIPRYIWERLRINFGVDFTEFRLVAITQEQIEEYNIPPMPTKTSDSRSSGFIAKHGCEASVELDALEPNTLQTIIDDNVSQLFDESIGEETEKEQEEKRKEIQELIDEE